MFTFLNISMLLFHGVGNKIKGCALGQNKQGIISGTKLNCMLLKKIYRIKYYEDTEKTSKIMATIFD